jgi:hypothetical protein
MRARHCVRAGASRGVSRLRQGGMLLTVLGFLRGRDALRGVGRGRRGRRTAEVPRRPPQVLAPSIRLWVVCGSEVGCWCWAGLVLSL